MADEALLAGLRAKDAKVRAQTLDAVAARLAAGALAADEAAPLAATLASLLGDSNVKASSAACDLVAALCESEVSFAVRARRRVRGAQRGRRARPAPLRAPFLGG